MTDQTNALSPVLSSYFLQMTDTFFVAFDQHQIAYANNAVTRVLGYSASDLTGTDDLRFVVENERQALKNRLDNITGSSDYFILHVQSTAGEVIDLKCHLMPVFLNDKKIVMLEGVDETATLALKKKNDVLEDKLSHLSPIDLDTRLPSLILLDDRIEQAILRTLREAKGNLQSLTSYIMVMALSVNGLDQIQDQFGSDGKRDIQDVLISRFRASIRSVDSLAKDPDGCFYFLFEGIRERQNIELIKERLHSNLNVPILYNEKSIKFTVNIGTSLYPEDGTSSVALIKSAKMNLIANLKD